MPSPAAHSLRQDAEVAWQWAAMAVLGAYLALLPFEGRVLQIPTSLGLGAAFLAIILYALRVREIPPRPFRIAAAVLFVPLLAAVVLVDANDVRAFDWFASGVLAAAAFCGGFALLARREEHLAVPGLRPVMIPVLLLFLVFFLSCFASEFPDLSFRDYSSRGVGVHAALAVLLGGVILARRSPLWFFRLLSSIGGLWLIAGLGVAIVFVFAGRELRLSMENAQLVRDVGRFVEQPVFRQQFPFRHPNSLAFFALVASFVALMAAAAERRRSLRVLWTAVFFAGIVAVMLTQTRGALAAALVGVVVAVVFAPRAKSSLAVLGGMALLVVLLGVTIAPMRERLASSFRAETYTHPSSTFVQRTKAWRAAVDMGRQRPLLGMGYGWSVYHGLYRRDYQIRYRDFEQKADAHNAYLEAWAESGAPGAILYLSALGCIAVVLIRHRRRVPWAPASLGLLASVIVLGLTQNTLRGGLSGLTWLALLAASAMQRGEDAVDAGSTITSEDAASP